MEQLRFSPLDKDDQEDLFELNSLLTPVGQRYQGMSCFDVIVKNGDRYLMVEMGGMNGWSQKENEEKYKKITMDQLISYEEMIASIQKDEVSPD